GVHARSRGPPLPPTDSLGRIMCRARAESAPAPATCRRGADVEGSAHMCERRGARRATALLEVLLVVVLGLVERLCGLDLRHDRSGGVRLLARLRTRCGLLLLLIVEQHDRPVLA